MPGPDDEDDAMAAAEGRGDGHLRASDADREQVIGTLKAAFAQGRLTEDELDARAGQVYASRTYAELAGVTADLPVGLAGAQPPRDPWRATKVALGVVYALILPGLFMLAELPRAPSPTTVGKVLTSSVVVYVTFWILGVCVMVACRLGKRSGGQPPPQSASGAAVAGVTRALKAALVQGRLTEDEYDERMGHASASRSRAELAALTADLPVDRMDAPARPPTAEDVRIGVIVSVAAASVAAAILLWHPGNGLAFLAFFIAAVTVLVAPIVTVGMLVDARRQKRSSW
jgi:Domain of unknown function (DUF1707)